MRIYLPMDLNAEAILRRLDVVIACFGSAKEANEIEYESAVDQIIWQLEIYDQVRFLRSLTDEKRRHSKDGMKLAEAIIKRLEGITDECAEFFPFEMIDKLHKEYLLATE